MASEWNWACVESSGRMSMLKERAPGTGDDTEEEQREREDCEVREEKEGERQCPGF